ncbi:MAG TPA: BON domain-containing protein [Pirellulales bacterium]|jgi:osmotically-inducible protein OsmY|nr:BON domain-containing protein [Pirellulales bacterium]
MIDIVRPVRSHYDLELEGRVRAFLLNSVPGLDEIVVNASRGVVTLEGYVNTDRTKSLCADAGQRVAGVVRLVNQLEVWPGTAWKREAHEIGAETA